MSTPSGAYEVFTYPDGSLRDTSYYFSFTLTGVEAVDRILAAVCAAGKAYHSTEMWDEEVYGRGFSYIDLIQQMADEAAAAMRPSADEQASS